METAAETELERKFQERREKSARMKQQVSQQKDQTVERMDISKDEELCQAFNRLSLKVGQSQWRPIARQLGFSRQEIRDIEQNSVFLSYQWDLQDKVLLLHDRLQERGYSCWMDIKQMGGGDSLYEMMDKGIRGAKEISVNCLLPVHLRTAPPSPTLRFPLENLVVVSCVTPPYAESANCRNEVALAHTLKTPIIPVMLEKTTWPPPGPMSIPFAQLLFINMAKGQDEDPWKGALFEELVRMVDSFVKRPKAK
uniref:TIR domain-containing protein n=1 Tax=Branchiostoma floridae TaxID=7739 RepID=C3ZQ15_BRAFL|eukprot:XP_002589383.1 hypothetical protein BRAFLDRAFT_77825 [Branchiostoma floridae]